MAVHGTCHNLECEVGVGAIPDYSKVRHERVAMPHYLGKTREGAYEVHGQVLKNYFEELGW